MITLDIPHIHSHFTREKIGDQVLFPEEKKQASSFDEKRMLDFCRGRYCAHECCKVYQMESPILISDTGVPLFPDGIQGSISHSMNLAGAVSCNTGSYLAIGLDIETIGRVRHQLWNLLFTTNENQYLSQLDKSRQAIESTLFYSLKEAFYKMQFQITNQFLDFHDVEIQRMHNSFQLKCSKHVFYDASENEIIVKTHQTGKEVITCLLAVK